MNLLTQNASIGGTLKLLISLRGDRKMVVLLYLGEYFIDESVIVEVVELNMEGMKFYWE